ncbi:MAG: type II toxin-antitoxin system VapC family toxin [Caldilineaceae bacterium]|nr:type II toxin-antitoxin system VapC family toxin [Caldilineaceae bacterium]
MGTLLERIDGRSPIGVDSAPFIYYFEQHPDWFPIVAELFSLSTNAPERAMLYTSSIILAEVLVLPLREQLTQLYNQYLSVFLNSPSVRILDIDTNVLLMAASLRASYGLRAADAIQISCCIEAGCEVFVTNDKRLQKVKEIEIIVLADCDSPTIDK